jgi:hypothetical protein
VEEGASETHPGGVKCRNVWTCGLSFMKYMIYVNTMHDPPALWGANVEAIMRYVRYIRKYI